MKTNHVLIDYENVQPEVAEALAQPVFKVWIFVGAQQHKVKYDLIELLQRKGDDARCIKISATARNALDFHMAYYVGQLATEHPEAYFHLIAKDTGMDPLVEHLQGRGLNVSRWADVFDISIIKRRADEPEQDKLSSIIEYLVRRGAQRPATLKTLLGSIAALFSPKLSESEATALVEQLKLGGVLETSGSKIKYGLPD
jgi:hypothetical protein